jgi:hypothetical protein
VKQDRPLSCSSNRRFGSGSISNYGTVVKYFPLANGLELFLERAMGDASTNIGSGSISKFWSNILSVDPTDYASTNIGSGSICNFWRNKLPVAPNSLLHGSGRRRDRVRW